MGGTTRDLTKFGIGKKFFARRDRIFVLHEESHDLIEFGMTAVLIFYSLEVVTWTGRTSG